MRNYNLRTQSMTENEVDFLPLRVTGVTAAGKRKFDAEGKRRLIEGAYFPCEIWRWHRAEPLASRLCGSVACAQSAIAQATGSYGFMTSKRQTLHESNDYPENMGMRLGLK